jgi:methionyl-tRNA synthetase
VKACSNAPAVFAQYKLELSRVNGWVTAKKLLKSTTGNQKGCTVITFDEFKKLDFRVATIVESEPVPGTKNLLKLQIDLGELGTRQIVTGLAQYYSAESLVGRQLVVLVNLKPAVFRGEKSEGMLLAAEVGKQGDVDYQVVLIVPERELPAGTPVH